MNSIKKSESSFIFRGQKKEFLDWLESLRISKYWLDTMNVSESCALCNEIHQVLKGFKELELAEKEKLFSLIEINSCLNGVYEKLKINYLNARLPLNKEQQDIAQVIIYTYMDLANAYYEIVAVDKSKKSAFSEQNLALTACKSLQGLGIAFLTSVQIYILPPKGFWLLCYQIFNTAEKFNTLEHKVRIDNVIYSAAILFKRLIIFYVIDKNKFSPTELMQIFQDLLRGINHVQNYISALNDENIKSSNEVFGFSLEKDEPPAIQKNVSLTTAKLLRYVSKVEIIKVIQFLFREAKEHSVLKNAQHQVPGNLANPLLFSRILETLEYKKKKNTTRIKKQHECCAVVGLDNLLKFLFEKEGKKSVPEKKIQLPEHKDELDNLAAILDFESEDNKEPEEEPLIIEKLQVIDSSIGGYGILWPNIKDKLQIGEVIGIMPDCYTGSKKIEIGLIRRIRVVNQHVIFGVELIGLESTLIYIEQENGFMPGEWLPFLYGSPNYEFGILCYKEKNYQAGDRLFVQVADKKISCQLGDVLNSTSVLDHIALSY